MFDQIALGTVLILVTVAIAGVSAAALEAGLERARSHLVTPPHRPKLIVVICTSSLWLMAMVTADVWLWAVTFHLLGVFPGLEEALYFALVCFTTLGFGDVLLPVEWRILGGMAAANGVLNFGLMTAFLVESIRAVRHNQQRHRRR